MLIETLDGYINSLDIVRVTQGRDYAVIKTRDGETWRSHAEADDIAARSAPVVQALPGYAALRAWPDEGDGLFVTRTPIVAWRIVDDMARPVTPDSADDETYILCPDNRVIAPCCTIFASEEAWLKDQLEERKRERAKNQTAQMAVS